MKKVLLILTTIMLSFMLFNVDVFADIEGSAGNKSDGGSPCTPTTCTDGYYSPHIQGLRITIVDQNGVQIPGTVSVDYLTEDSKGKAQLTERNTYYNVSRGHRKETAGASISNIFTLVSGSALPTKQLPGLQNFIGDAYYELSYNKQLYDSYFEAYFKNMANNNYATFVEYVYNATGYKAIVEENADLCRYQSNTYFIIEPLNRITINGEGTFFGTGTELIKVIKKYGGGLQYHARFRLSNAIYVEPEYKNNPVVGYYGVDTGYQSFDKILNPLNGYSVGVFWLPDFGIIECKPTCYKETTVCSTTACDDTNANNERVCYSVMVEDNDDNLSDCDTNNKASGKKTYTLQEGVCSLYCTETGSVSYPGNVAPAIKAGTNLAWPTANGEGMYPLTTSSTLTCKIEMEDGSSDVSQTCRNLASQMNYQYINGSTTATLTYNDTKVDQEVSLKSSCNVSVDKLDVYGNDIRITNSCSYSLPENKNIAVNKETLEFVGNLNTDAVTNYILIEKYNGVLPIEGFNWNDTEMVTGLLFGKDYKLEITNMPLGYGGRFTSALNSMAYTCNYQVTTDVSGSCTCPPGTLYSGYDVEGVLKQGQVTCAEAKETFCNAPYCEKADGTGIAYLTDCLTAGNKVEYCKLINGCSNEIKVCPENTDNAGYPYELDPRYTACLSGGSSETTCIDMLCNCRDNCSYACPEGTLHAGKDISSCVFEQRGAGKTLVAAKKVCEQKECDGGGDIIYRTISLENPFPGKGAYSGSSKFNDDVKGRTPGSNWNSETLVKNVILNNRGYDGSKIYEEATPLYTINLDAVAIKQIREYNKKQNKEDEGYADFELSCTDGAYCISSFLHSGQFTTADGNSILDVHNSTCASAKDKKSFIACYRKASTTG